jgi:hypothetical protein
MAHLKAINGDCGNGHLQDLDYVTIWTGCYIKSYCIKFCGFKPSNYQKMVTFENSSLVWIW